MRILIVVLLASCGSTTLKRAGEACASSSECDKGLLCDTAVHKCAGMGSVDAAIMVDAAPKPLVDAPAADAFVFLDAPSD